MPRVHFLQQWNIRVRAFKLQCFVIYCLFRSRVRRQVHPSRKQVAHGKRRSFVRCDGFKCRTAHMPSWNLRTYLAYLYRYRAHVCRNCITVEILRRLDCCRFIAGNLTLKNVSYKLGSPGWRFSRCCMRAGCKTPECRLCDLSRVQ